MKKDKPTATKAPRQRRRAREPLRKTTEGEGQPQPEARAQRGLREPQVRQTEPEIQNKGLLQAREAVAASLERYTDLYDFAPVGYFCLDPDGSIQQVNLTGASLLGVERAGLVGQRLEQFVAETDRPAFKASLQHAFQRRAKVACEVELHTQAETRLAASLELVAPPAGHECRVAVIDVTGRERAEQATKHLAKFPSENPNPVLRIDRAGCILYANEASSALLREWGNEVGQLGPKRWRDLAADVSAADEPTTVDLELKGRALSFAVVPVAGAGYVNFYGMDITHRKRAEAALQTKQEQLTAANIELASMNEELREGQEQLRRLNRTLVAHADSSRALMQVGGETDYLNEVCRIVAEDCGHPMVWIGYAEHDEEKTVRPAASAGFEAGYLETLQITWGDGERGRGPTGAAIRTGQSAFCQNVLTDPDFAPWRDEALKWGYLAALTVPLRAEAGVFGALTVYFRETDPCSEVEVALLRGLAEEMASGIQTLRLRAANAQAEADLHAAHAELEKRVEARTCDLQRANAQLQAEVADRRRVEQALLQANELLERVFASIDLLVAYLDENFNFTRVNRAFAEAGDHAPEFYIGKNLFACCPNPTDEADFRRVAATGQSYSVYEKPFAFGEPPGSAHRYWDWSLQPVLDANGGVQGLVFSLVDVTQRKQAEDQLRRNALRSQAVAEISQAVAEAKFDDQLVIGEVTRRTAELFGDLCLISLLYEDGPGLAAEAYHHPDPAIETALRERLPAGPGRLTAGRISRHIIQSGQPLLIPAVNSAQGQAWFEPRDLTAAYRLGVQSFLAMPLRLHGRVIGQFVLVRLRPGGSYTAEDQQMAQNLADRTALAIVNARLYRDAQAALAKEQATRAQLIQTEKLAAMGRVIASVAHELNNPLQTIRNCLYLTAHDLPSESPIHDYLAMASSETLRLTNLAAQLRVVYRPRLVEQREPLNLLRVLDDVRMLMAPALETQQVQWCQNCFVADAWISGVADELKQVFINLSQNAGEAMQPEGGALSVEVACSADGQRVGATFRDTGPGIASDNLDRLFEPFFTTKSTGLGLGLSISNDIVQRHGGTITVASEPGRGAAFTVWLPLERGPKSEIRVETSRQTNSSG